MTAHDIKETLLAMADADKARHLMRFFKTGPGQYGEGDRFLGITNPQVRLVVKEAWKDCTIEMAERLAQDEWHEVRNTGLLIMVNHFQQAMRKKDKAVMTRVFETYTRLHPFINNWDLVDLSAPKIVGHYEMIFPEEGMMDEWIKPDHTLWQQRISMVATWQHVRCDHFGQLVARAETLLPTKEDLLQKAAGWMLREMGQHSEAGREALLGFFDAHVEQMPATMLSYALEKFPSDVRLYWRNRRKGL